MLKKFKKELKEKKKPYKKFLKKFDEFYVADIEKMTAPIEKETWAKVDCLDCGNCCKKMTPTFTPTDVKRISAHLKMTQKAFKEKWLDVDEDNGDIVNKSTPCQFLDLEDNKCSIYEVRPSDCAGFPHFDKKDFGDYNHVYAQNLSFCPATMHFVGKLRKQIKKEYVWK